MKFTTIFQRHLPVLISGVGVLLGFQLIAQGFFVLTRPGTAPEGFLSGAATSGPFIAGLVYGGYWLYKSEITPHWYPHLGRWWVGMMVGFVALILGISLSMERMDPVQIVAAVRWSAAIGGGIGLVVGIFYARGLQRFVEAEQARRRQKETKRERDRLDKFADIISHDLRNPLRVAEGHLDLLAEEHESPHIAKIESAHDRMRTIIEDTLSLARAGQAIDETQPVELRESAERSWETVDTADAQLRLDGEATIVADEDRLYQLFENVFRNAIEHGGPDVTVRVGTLERSSGFYIADDGPGIPEEELDKVFDTGYTSSETGTGVGLNIVQEIVEAHDWDIEATESQAGGARFNITGVTSN